MHVAHAAAGRAGTGSRQRETHGLRFWAHGHAALATGNRRAAPASAKGPAALRAQCVCMLCAARDQVVLAVSRQRAGHPAQLPLHSGQGGEVRYPCTRT